MDRFCRGFFSFLLMSFSVWVGVEIIGMVNLGCVVVVGDVFLLRK